jgi:Bacterial Ig-like domain
MKILKAKSARYTTSAVLISSLFAACGGGGGGGTPTAAPPAQQAPAATVLSTSPKNLDRGVGARQPIVITFSGDLDRSTVIPNNVLVTGNGVTAPVSVQYDPATFRLTILPQQPLSDGVQYTVAVAGIRDVAGNAIPNSTFSYKTYITGSPKVQFYDVNGLPTRNTVATVDPVNDNIVQFTTYSDAAGTIAIEYQKIEYDARGNPSRYANYTAGGDNKANTIDDVLVSSTTQSYDDKGNITQLINFTAAGAVDKFTTKSYNANGYATQIINYTGVGADGKIGGLDDEVSTYTNKQYNARNALTQEVTYQATGKKITAADVPTVFASQTYDTVGNMIQRVDYANPGPDSIPFNGNDAIDLDAKTTYDGNGNPIQTVFSKGTAAALAVVGYVKFTFGNYGLTLLEAFDGTVSAGTYHHYTKTIYDPVTGNLVSRTTYNGPGANGTWDPALAASDDRKGEAGNYYGGF